MSTLVLVCLWTAFGLSILFTAYIVLLVAAWVRGRATPPGEVDAFQWHFLVPARDEEAVIGETVSYLRGTFPPAHVWVVDDASEDATATIVDSAAAGDDRIHLIRRVLPDARTGKSDALNVGYRTLGASLDPETDRARVVVIIVDADGRPSPQFLTVAAGPDLFGDPNIGGVQVEVRMSNRDAEPPPSRFDPLAAWWHRTFVRQQDQEFRTVFMAMQLQRRWTRSENLGGNGQLNRLSALDELGGDSGVPWRGSLLEDFELGLALLLAGWRNGATREAWVEQEALWRMRRYVTQRTRWAQGSMECMRYLLDILRSGSLTFRGKAEIVYFLVRPWLQIVGSFAFPVAAFFTFAWALGVWSTGGRDALPELAFFLIGAVVGAAVFMVWAFLYKWRCEPDTKWRNVLALAVLTLGLGVIAPYEITWRAFVRLARGKSGWAKTRRNIEPVEGPIAKEG